MPHPTPAAGPPLRAGVGVGLHQRPPGLLTQRKSYYYYYYYFYYYYYYYFYYYYYKY